MRTVLVVVALTVALAGCGSGTSTAREVPDELTEHPARTCPAALPVGADPGGHGFGVEDAATDTPDLPSVDQAWICQYDAAEVDQGSTGTTYGWTLDGAAAPVGSAALPAFSAALDELVPRAPDASYACPADLGPRWLVAFATDRDLSGVVVDGYGCADLRLTDQPFTAAAGATSGGGTVPGALPAPTSLLRAIQSVVGDRSRFHALIAIDAALDLPCAASEQRHPSLDVPGPGRSTPEEAAAPYAGGDRLVMTADVITQGTSRINVIGSDGLVRRVIELSLHRDGWWPDGYVEC